MTHVITQSCCNDASCLSVCPVHCIRPRPGDPQFSSVEQLYIDPDLCIDCGACFDVCPVSAIEVDYYLTEQEQEYLQINSEYFERHPIVDRTPVPLAARRLPAGKSLRVAIIGAGPAGCYATDHLLQTPGVEISVFDRLPTPHGLARAGVAPDHQRTRSIGKYFDSVLSRPEVSCFFNVEVGRDIRLDDLLEYHDAVIWAAGATGDRALAIPGENLPGCHSAREFVAWYNGHPDYADYQFDLSGTHVVIIGNGNVALDAARMLVQGVDELNGTDIAHHAITALRTRGVREVTVAARRGPANAAYTLSELLALTHLEKVSLVTRSDEVLPRGKNYVGNPLKLEIVEQAANLRSHEDTRINLRYLLSPIAIEGDRHVQSVTFMRNMVVEEEAETRVVSTGERESLKASLVLRAIGYRGRAVQGLPFDEEAGTITNKQGRVIDPHTTMPVPGCYCAGWIKRGATGVLGTNKICAAETVNGLLDDFERGLLATPRRTREHLSEFIAARVPEALDFAAWTRIDAAELLQGKTQRRARSKFVTLSDMLDAAIAGH
jgi:ferredoxin/flavodoxin---NADP+ reductase